MNTVPLSPNEIPHLLENVQTPLAKYLWIQEHGRIDSLNNTFQTKFRGYYRIRRGSEWYSVYFKMLAQACMKASNSVLIALTLGFTTPVMAEHVSPMLSYKTPIAGGIVTAQFTIDPLPTFGGVPIIRGPNSSKEDELKMRARAEAGDAVAQFTLGFWYQQGDGVRQDYFEAVKWFKKSAEEGYPRAHDAIGKAYISGQGVPKSETEAFKWFRSAAERGFVDSQITLGNMYQMGAGTPQDFVLAHVWFNLAGQRSPEGRERRDLLANRMLPAQLAEAQKLARDCLRRNYSEC